jgi:SET domain-containing protein
MSASKSRVIVKTSRIHGRGAFAAESIAEGSLVGLYSGEETQADGPHVLWVEDEEGQPFGIRGTGPLRFVNHSNEPNAEFQGVELVALRGIEVDEELTADYGPEWSEGSE